jgi:hypothetical protein
LSAVAIRVPLLRGRGFGAYPTDPCYDPNRPSWLPYWLDDLTESDCKYPNGVLSDLPQAEANIGGVIGQTVGSGVSDVASGVATATEAAATGAVTGGVSDLSTGGGVLLLGAAVIGTLVLLALVKK